MYFWIIYLHLIQWVVVQQWAIQIILLGNSDPSAEQPPMQICYWSTVCLFWKSNIRSQLYHQVQLRKERIIFLKYFSSPILPLATLTSSSKLFFRPVCLSPLYSQHNSNFSPLFFFLCFISSRPASSSPPSSRCRIYDGRDGKEEYHGGACSQVSHPCTSNLCSLALCLPLPQTQEWVNTHTQFSLQKCFNPKKR